MLIEFSIGNYRSFKQKVTFSMEAANLVAIEKKLDEDNLFAVDEDLSLLKSAAIYGANASGKSNLVKALNFMKMFMINSSKDTQSVDDIPVEPFRLSTETENKPSYFELVFIMDGQKYRYGFEATQKKIVTEWLCYIPTKRETKLFKRDIDGFNIAKKYNAEGLQQKTRDNALFLSVSAQFNVDIAEKILDWLTNHLNIISGLSNRYLSYTINCLLKDKNKSDIIELIKNLDLGIENVIIEEKELKLEDIPDELREFIKKSGQLQATSIITTHKKFDSDGNRESNEQFDLNEHESEGTNKVFSLAGILLDTLSEGKTLVIDEFDARLHPLISKAIVELFNSNQTNSYNAQLIFITHDTNLLNNKLLRRDQIWFTEKDRYGATTLYSLAEYKIRNDASFESDYIKGKYGAIPYLGDLSHLFDSDV